MILSRKRAAFQASALIITLIFIVLLGLEALIIALYLSRSTGMEAVLRGENVRVKHAASLALNSLEQSIYRDVSNGLTLSQLWAKYKREGSDTTYSNLISNRFNVVNPETGVTNQLDIDTSAWIQEYRGNYFHLVGRARTNTVDLITHKWTTFKPCQAFSTLTTIVTGFNQPGTRATLVEPTTGRVFFSNVDEDSNSSSNFYSWSPATGLSTLLPSNRSGVGTQSAVMASDGRIFIGSGVSGNDGFWTWKDNILSTIVDGLNGAGRWNANNGKYTVLDTRNDRVYFGTAWQSNIFTWKNNQLTTILTDTGFPSDTSPAGGRMVLGASDEVIFTDNTSGNWLLQRWTAGSGLQTLMNFSALGVTNKPTTFASMSDGRVWISEVGGSNRMYTYKAGILSTISGTGYNMPPYFDNVMVPFRFSEFIGGMAFLSSTSQAYYWDPSYPQVLNAIGNAQGYSSTINASRTMIAFADDAIGAKLYVWSPTNGLSTIGSGDYPGWQDGMLWYGDRLYFRNGLVAPNSLYAWDASTQSLSTIFQTNKLLLGTYGGIKLDENNGRIYIGSDDTTSQFYTYSPHTGLTTVLANATRPGGSFAMAINPVTGGIYIGEDNNTGNFYYFSGINCSELPF